MELAKLGSYLREGRAALGLTLRDAEEKTGVSNAYLSQLEGGKIKQPSPVVLHKLCEAFEISYALTMEYAGYPVPEEAKFATAEHKFMSRLGGTTPVEQDEILRYLRFLRTKSR
jgi:transcriptional regulator with XRE-family HTH domain